MKAKNSREKCESVHTHEILNRFLTWVCGQLGFTDCKLRNPYSDVLKKHTKGQKSFAYPVVVEVSAAIVLKALHLPL